MPIMPAFPRGELSVGVTMSLIVPLVRRTFTGPGRWVKNIVPSDRNAMSHGLVSPATKLVVVVSVGEPAGGPRSGGGGGNCGTGGAGVFAGTQAAKMEPRHRTARPAPTLRRNLTGPPAHPRRPNPSGGVKQGHGNPVP